MPQKKTSGKIDPRVANRSHRSAPFTPEQLRSEISTIRKALAEIEALAKAMDKKDIDEVVVDGQTLLSRARMLLKKFKVNLEYAIGRAELTRP